MGGGQSKRDREIEGKVCVIGSEYCSSETTELAVARKVIGKPERTIFVGDNNNNIVFKMEVKTSSFSLHEKRVLLDSHGTPILTFRDKIMSLHSRWSVYRGKSTRKNDLIFTAKQSKMIGSKKALSVYLANNKKEKKIDFRVSSSSDKIYLGSSRKILIAEMRDYIVKIYRNVDQVFIISLIVILDAINQQSQQNKDAGTQAVIGGINSATTAFVA